MADERKFLDAEGLRYFWEMCRLQNNEDFQTNLEIFEAMAAALATKMESPDGKGGVSQYFTAEEKAKLAKIASIRADGGLVTTNSSNEAVQIATEKYVDQAIGNIPVATDDILGLVKTSEEVTAQEDGTLGVGAIPIAKVTGLKTELVSLENKTVIGMTINDDTNVLTYWTGDGEEHSFLVPDKDTTYSLATDEELGLTRLYATTGSAEDGTMTQKAITEELNKKVGVELDGDTLIFTI